MDASEIIELETSRAGWRVLSIVLISLISAIVIGGIFHNIGRTTLLSGIKQSGYSILEVNTLTNRYFVIERQN